MERKWNGHKGEIVDSKNNFDVIECKVCKFKHIVPIPTEQDINKEYKTNYYEEAKSLELYSKRYLEDEEWWNIVYGDRFNTFFEYFGEKKDINILDIGSGPGYFIQYGKEHGWTVDGIEPSMKAVEYSKKRDLNVFCGFYNEETSKKLGKYDVIHMNYVLEHIQNPGEILELTKKTLNPGGLLCVCVPNDYNPFQMALKNCCDFNSWWFVAPHHINYFNFDSLEKLFIDKGFKILNKESTFPMDLFLLMGDNYIDNNELGRIMHKKRKNFDITISKYDKELRNKLYKKLSDFNIGREIIIYGIND